jgi:peptidoglycan/LPS O-acetylase OafA/YrhL
MNGNVPGRPDDDEGLDPELLQLFDSAKTPAGAADAFAASVLVRMQQTRRLRLIRQLAGLAIMLIAGAFLAPYVAQQTLFVADWFTEELPATGIALVSPIGGICATFLAWRIARWARK